jgi:transcriptional regulator with XRE-family HTH domain
LHHEYDSKTMSMRSRIQDQLMRNPGQKAREIAARLGTDRSTVNQILHGHKDLFVQDPKEFTWSLAGLRVDLEGHRWLDSAAFEDAILAAGSPLRSAIRRVTFVVGEECKILLEALARLLAISNQLATSGSVVSIDFSTSRRTLAYLNRIGFIDLLDDRVHILPKRPQRSAAAAYEGNNDGVVELRAIDHLLPDDDIPGLLRNSFVSCAGNQYNVAAHTVISELFRNVTEHSCATSAGFAGLQYYAGGKRRHIQTVISDGGRGIVGTLMPILSSKYPRIANEIEASPLDPRVALLQKVFSEGGISQVNEPGRGLGLKGSGEYAQKYNAVVSVRQDTFELKVTHSQGQVQFSHRLGLAQLAGTHICFDFLLD